MWCDDNEHAHSIRLTKVHACKRSVSNKGTHFYITWDGSALTLWHTYTRRTIVTDLEGCGKKNTNALSIQHTHTAHILPTHDTTPTVTPDPLSCFLQTVYDKAVRYSAVSETGLHNHKDTAKGYHSQLSNLFTICIFLGTFDCCIAYIAHQLIYIYMYAFGRHCIHCIKGAHFISSCWPSESNSWRWCC